MGHFKQWNHQKKAQQCKNWYQIDHVKDTCLPYENWNKKAKSQLKCTCQAPQAYCLSVRQILTLGLQINVPEVQCTNTEAANNEIKSTHIQWSIIQPWNEILIPATVKMNLENFMLSEINQTPKKGTHITWFHLYEISRIGKLSGLWGKGGCWVIAQWV